MVLDIKSIIEIVLLLNYKLFCENIKITFFIIFNIKLNKYL